MAGKACGAIPDQMGLMATGHSWKILSQPWGQFRQIQGMKPLGQRFRLEGATLQSLGQAGPQGFVHGVGIGPDLAHTAPFDVGEQLYAAPGEAALHVPVSRRRLPVFL